MRHDRTDYQGKGLDEIISDPNEPVFVIRGQDLVSGDAVRAWAQLAKDKGAATDIIQSALEHADRMDAWRPKRLPDLPDESATGFVELMGLQVEGLVTEFEVDPETGVKIITALNVTGVSLVHDPPNPHCRLDPDVQLSVGLMNQKHLVPEPPPEPKPPAERVLEDRTAKKG